MKRQAVAVVTVALLALTGCKGDPVTGGSQQGFVSGNGDVRVLSAAERDKPSPTVSGTTLDGDHVSLADYAGKVVVMPVWGSWCGPCRAEAPMLKATAEELAPQGVQFLGINGRDTSADNGRAFQRNHALPYPSIYDSTGALLLSFNAGLSPKSIPAFLFIDPQGRVAAAIDGETTATTIKDIVEEISQ